MTDQAKQRRTNLIGGTVLCTAFILLLIAVKIGLHITNPTLNLGLQAAIAILVIALIVSIVLYFVKPSLYGGSK